MAIAHSLDWPLSFGFICRSRSSLINSHLAATVKFPFPFVLFFNLSSQSVRADSSACSPPLLEEEAPAIELGLGFEEKPESLQADYVELNLLICSFFKDPATESIGYECYQSSKGRADFRPQIQTIKFLIRYLIQSKDWGLLFALSNDFKNYRVFPDQSTCSKLISACVKARKLKLVHSFLEVFVENDPEISTVGIESALRGFNQLHMYRNSVDLYQKFQSYNLDLSLTCCYLIMEAHLKMEKSEKAVAVFHEFKNAKDSSSSSSHSKVYLILCESLGKMGRSYEAVACFREMLKKGIAENHEFYSSLIRNLVRGGELEMAEELMLEGESKKMIRNPDLFFQLIVKYVEVGTMEKALDVVALMKRANIKVSDCILCAVVNGFRRKRGSKAALQVYKNLVLQGHEPGQVTYASILNIYVHQGLYSMAESILAEMEKRGFDKCVVAYSTMIVAYAKQGKTREATRLVAKMKSQGCYPNIWTYNSLLEMYGKALNLRQMEKILKEMSRRKITPNRVSYTSIISAYNRIKDYGTCVKYYEEFKLTGEKVDAILAGILVAVFSKTNQVDELIELLQDMKSEGMKLDTRFYRSALVALRDAGLEVQARWLEGTLKKS